MDVSFLNTTLSIQTQVPQSGSRTYWGDSKQGNDFPSLLGMLMNIQGWDSVYIVTSVILFVENTGSERKYEPAACFYCRFVSVDIISESSLH